MTEVNERTDAAGPADLGRVLRALRRRADLSQRQLAERAGVPQPTLARIESGRARDPRFRTVERLVQAAGGEVAIVGPEAEAASATSALPSTPHDDMRDRAGRRYPAHLDVWPVTEPRDWPGAWWAEWYRLPPERYPLPLPPAAYELNRRYRDNRRWAENVRRSARVRRVTGEDVPIHCWRFVVELPGGELLGELRAHERSPHLEHGEWYPGIPEREMVLDGVLVVTRYRRLGLGRRLVSALISEMRAAGIHDAVAVAEGFGTELLLACGFEIEARRPFALRLRPPMRRTASIEQH